jgi:hypothetical protein
MNFKTNDQIDAEVHADKVARLGVTYLRTQLDIAREVLADATDRVECAESRIRKLQGELEGALSADRNNAREDRLAELAMRRIGLVF